MLNSIVRFEALPGEKDSKDGLRWHHVVRFVALHGEKDSKDGLRWHNVKILFWLVNSSEKKWWSQLDCSIGMLWSSPGEEFHIVSLQTGFT